MTAVQQPPEPARSYGSFPQKTIASGTAMFRAHRADRSAWWFDSTPHGRFNLSNPRGTCCTATRAETAIREKVRDEVNSTGVVSRVFAESFALSMLSAPVEYTCAAVSSNRAERFGVVRDLVTTAAVHLRGPQACEAAGMTVTGPPRLSALTVVEKTQG